MFASLFVCFQIPFPSANVRQDRQPAMLPSSDSMLPPPYPDDIPSGESIPSLRPSVPVMTVADLQRRQAELDQRAAQLDLREKQAQQQEAWRLEHGYGTVEG